jgi:hypothetical protein
MVCKNCQKSLKVGQGKFCSHSCSSTFYNKDRKIEIHCLFCGISVYGDSHRKYCSKKCQQATQRKNFIQRWKLGLEKGWTSKTVLISAIIRDYLFVKFNNKCAQCRWGEVNQHSCKIPLQVHHIDGDAKNCQENNLNLLCPNCHSLTENFGGCNKKSSRSERYA